MLRTSALQPLKWQLTSIGYSTAVQASSAHCSRNRLWTRSCSARRTTPQSATPGLHPVIHVPNYMDHYSYTDPWGMDDWVGHVGLTTKWSHIQLVQDRESSPQSAMLGVISYNHCVNLGPAVLGGLPKCPQL